MTLDQIYHEINYARFKGNRVACRAKPQRVSNILFITEIK